MCWHAHDDEDELGYVLSGRLRVELRDRTVELGPGELFVVSKGVEHNPIADDECLVMLVERKATQHTGDQVIEATRSIEEQFRYTQLFHNSPAPDRDTARNRVTETKVTETPNSKRKRDLSDVPAMSEVGFRILRSQPEVWMS